MKLKDFGSFVEKASAKEWEKMYNTYRRGFIAYMLNHFSIDIEKIVEIYQESFVALYENSRDGRIISGSEFSDTEIETYLFAIGRHKLYNCFRDSVRASEVLLKMKAMEEINGKEPFFDEELKKIIRDEVMKLGEPCNQILQLFYYERKKLEEIAQIVGYKNEQVAKNKRLSCTKLLKKIIKQKYNKDDFFYNYE